jgi:UDP-3-O-acyl-N-acetylglucosamine deacetylase
VNPMNSMINTFAGLVSSLLLNVGLTRLAEMVDPMQRDAGAIRNMTEYRTAAFTQEICNFRTAAFTQEICNFRTAAFTQEICNFRTAAFTQEICNFRPQGS